MTTNCKIESALKDEPSSQTCQIAAESEIQIFSNFLEFLEFLTKKFH